MFHFIWAELKKNSWDDDVFVTQAKIIYTVYCTVYIFFIPPPKIQYPRYEVGKSLT